MRKPIRKLRRRWVPTLWMGLLAIVLVGPAGAQTGFELHEAAIAGDTAAVRKLLDARVFANQKEGDGRTPLFFAAWNGHAEVIHLLLHGGAVIDEADNAHWTPLMAAAASGHVEAVRVLLEHDVDAGYSWNGRSAMTEARDAGHDAVVTLLNETSQPFGSIDARTVDPDRVYGRNEVDVTPERISGPQPMWPPGLDEVMTRGVCVGEFVLNADGRADPDTYRTVRCDHLMLAPITRQVLLGTRYSPAEIDGQPVRMLVAQQIAFPPRRQ